MRPKLGKEYLLKLIGQFEQTNGKLPRAIDMKLTGVCDKTFARTFGSWKVALSEYRISRLKEEFQAADSADSVTAEAPPTKSPLAANPLLLELEKNLSPRELSAVVQASRRAAPAKAPAFIRTLNLNRIKALFFADSHIGHKQFHEDWWFEMMDHAVEEKCEFGWHAGDILEGMSGRPGHIFELQDLGFESQFGHASSLLDQAPFPIRGITGNHDLWYAGKGDMGINVGQRLQAALPGKYFHLGDMEADEQVIGLTVKLWHGLDGASYATSYRTQKFVEGLTGGDKPHVLLSGHAHKAIHHECRNVQVVEGGTICAQTGFMRGKKLAAHTGYWVLEIFSCNEGLKRFTPQWNPFF